MCLQQCLTSTEKIIYQFLLLYIYKYMPILQKPDKCFEEKNGQHGIYVFALEVRKKMFRRRQQRNCVYCRLSQKGCEKLNTKSHPGDFLTYPKICIGFIKLLLLIGTKNCLESLIGMKGLGKSASACRPPGSISVYRVPVLPKGDTQDQVRLFLSPLTTDVAALQMGCQELWLHLKQRRLG